MDRNTPAKKTVGNKVKQVAMSVDQSFLLQLDPDSIRVFLRKYGAYRREVYTRTSQFTGESYTSLEPVNIVSNIYCVDADQLESAIECGMISDCTEVDKLTSTGLRNLLENKAQEFKDVVTEAEFTATVQATLKMKIYVKYAVGRMELLFKESLSLLRTNDIK